MLPDENHAQGREGDYEEVVTVVHDIGEGADLARIPGAIWPNVGALVELESPARRALVVGVRLVLAPGGPAIVRVDVQEPGDEELTASEEAEPVLVADLLPASGEAAGIAGVAPL